MTCASPGRRPSTAAGSTRASMHVSTASFSDGCAIRAAMPRWLSRAFMATRSMASTTPRSLSPNREVGEHSVVVAGPDPVDRRVVPALASFDEQGRPVVETAADEDVIDPVVGPVGGGHDRVRRRERLTALARVAGLPGVAIRGADAVQ